MKIVDNRVAKVEVAEVGDLVVGKHTGIHYLKLYEEGKFLKLKNLTVINDVVYCKESIIKAENVSIVIN